MRRVKGYCLDTDESDPPMTDEEPHIYKKDDTTFRDGRPSEGTWVDEGEGVPVIKMGVVIVQLNTSEGAINGPGLPVRRDGERRMILVSRKSWMNSWWMTVGVNIVRFAATEVLPSEMLTAFP